jgi:hypothetical protein
MQSTAERQYYDSLRPQIGASYRIKHKSLGTFTGMCVYSQTAWAAFKVLDGNSELAGIDINPGEVVELTTEFYRATEIKSEWNPPPVSSPKI